LPVTNLIPTSIVSQSGTWTNLSSASLAAVDANRATATLGSVVTVEITDAPSDYGTLTSLTLAVNWRISATISTRLRIITFEVLSGGSVVASFTTPTQGTGSADRTDTAVIDSLSLTKAEVDALQVRLTCTNASGGGASTANHLIDSAWLEMDYVAAAASIDASAAFVDSPEVLAASAEVMPIVHTATAALVDSPETFAASAEVVLTLSATLVDSEEVFAASVEVPLMPPESAVLLSAIFSSPSVNLSWTKGARATSYRIERRTMAA
jgi:hypothetical protein